jgi:hypothetical protein
MRESHVLTGALVCEVASVSPRLLQSMVEAGAVAPVERGSRGRGRHRRFSAMQALAVAYGAAFLGAGCHHSWAYEAVRFVCGLEPEEMAKAFAERRTLANLLPGGLSRLVKPSLKEDATREQRLMAEALDLEVVYRRVQRKAEALGVRLALEENVMAAPGTPSAGGVGSEVSEAE